MSFRRNTISVLLVVSIVSSSFLPVFAEKSRADILGGALDNLKSIGSLASVPTNDTVNNFKTNVLDTAMKFVAQALIAKIVGDTIRWANTGFEGNPTYVTNPGRYLANSANQIAGDYIQGTQLGFICSPFQNLVRVSLRNNYYQPIEKQFQCTFTGVAGNLEDFYNNFSAGGWQGWFSMTQNPSNNPYGAYLEAQVELDSRIANALDLQSKDLQINDGFLSTRDCLAYNPDQATLDALDNGNLGEKDGWYVVGNYADYAAHVSDASAKFWSTGGTANSCILYGDVKTPGKQIEDKVNQTLGSGFSQLVNAKNYDDLINALMAGLINRYVLGQKGLFGKDYGSGLPTPGSSSSDNSGSQAQISCTPSVRQALVGDTVTWSSTGAFSAVNSISGASTIYSWVGEDAPGNNVLASATSTSVSVQYLTPGTKTAAISATSIDPTSNIPKTASASCDSSVVVSKYPPLSVSCSAVSPTGTKGQIVSWKATISGGSGTLREVYWQGDESTVPKTHVNILPAFDPTTMQTISYNEPDVRVTSSGNSLIASYGGGYTTTQTVSRTLDQSGNTVTTITLSRPYTDSAYIPGNKSANITVLDSDPNTRAVANLSCGNQIFISN
jgi:plastocyanin